MQQLGHINEIPFNFPAAQEQTSGVISTETTRSLVNVAEERREVGVKSMVKMSRVPHNRNLVATVQPPILV